MSIIVFSIKTFRERKNAMLTLKDINPGDILYMPEAFPSDPVQYIFEMTEPDGEKATYVNAVSKSYIDRGMVRYGAELYKLEQGDLENAKKLGRYGVGNLKDGNEWYRSKERIDLIEMYAR